MHFQHANTFQEAACLHQKAAVTSLHTAFCKKIIQTIELRPGLWISIMDFYPFKALNPLNMKKKQSTIDFGYLLTGTMRRQIQSRSTKKTEFRNRCRNGGHHFHSRIPRHPGDSAKPNHTDSACSYHSRTFALPPEGRVGHSSFIFFNLCLNGVGKKKTISPWEK